MEPFTELASLPHASVLAGVSGTLASGAVHIFRVLGRACSWRLEGVCPKETECLVVPVWDALRDANAEIRQYARTATNRLCRESAPAVFVGTAAALDSQASQSTAVTPECNGLAGRLEENEARTCAALLDLGIACMHSLFMAARTVAEVFSTFSLPRDIPAAATAYTPVFVGGWGANRRSILAGVLTVASQLREDAVGAHDLLGAEIGVFQAETSTWLLQRFPDLCLLLVDPYHLHTGENDRDDLQFIKMPSKIFDIAALSTQPYRARATHVLQESHEAAKWIAADSLDFVFIDGDHRYDGVMRDIKAWWPTLRPGSGVLAGHDFAPATFPGVVAAVTEFVSRTGVQLFISPEVWWIVRPGQRPFDLATLPFPRRAFNGDTLTGSANIRDDGGQAEGWRPSDEPLLCSACNSRLAGRSLTFTSTLSDLCTLGASMTLSQLQVPAGLPPWFWEAACVSTRVGSCYI
eukprot:TRINITY_DN61853_c0_g1_i1.p1 TRINITY_DN61853_c0_g1~~TRINITY_DN61853_c0_g1_i1.p1  ORF type:complete len:522 (-),score=65.78 TRINITY_DN61853_c0_g1_i1:75-1469(-)